MNSIVIYDHDDDYHKPIAFPMILPFVMIWIGAANLVFYTDIQAVRMPG